MSVDKIYALGVENTDTSLLSAATYVGGGHTIVRLIPESLIEAESIAQATLGLNLFENHTVGKAEPRAVGFPAWPIIHDPDNAQHALNLVGDLEWARRHASSQAKKVKERFDALVGDLSNSAPHFVPTLLEELARIFSAAGNNSFAKQYFGRAREIERAHNIPVDPERHEAAFLEFARSGVVGAKNMTQEVTDASARLESPAAAFEYVLRLNVARIRAGQQPYAYLARDLRKLGATAGLSAKEVDAQLFDGIVGLSSVLKSPGGFWKATRTPLAEWLRSNPDRGEAFINDQPQEFSNEEWLEFLDEAGIWQRLIADDEAFLTWMQIVLGRSSYELMKFSPRLLGAIELLGDALRGTEIQGAYSQLPLEYVDALIAAGVKWTEAAEWKRNDVNWRGWAEQTSRTRDFQALVAHPEISELAAKSLEAGFVSNSLDLLLEVSGAKELLSRYLDLIASRVVNAQGAFAELALLINQSLVHLNDPRLMELNPEAMKTMTAFDSQAALSWAIRAGILAELAWPAMEESASRLQAESPDKEIEFYHSHPDLIVVCGDQFEVISGSSVRITGKLPVGARIESAFSVGDDVVFFYRPPSGWEIHVYWNGGTGQKASDSSGGYFRYGLGVTFPVPDGRLTDSGLLKVGATDKNYGVGELVCSLNSDQIYKFDYRGGSLWLADAEKFSDWEVNSKILPHLGLDEIGIALGADTEVGEVGEDGEGKLQPTIFPAFASTNDSLAGTYNGKHFTIRSSSDDTYRAVTPLGSFSAPTDFHYALSRPGGGVWLSRDLTLIDAESGNNLSRHSGYLDKLPVHAVHQLQARSPETSEVMRSCTPSDVKKLLDALQPEPERKVSSEAARVRPSWDRYREEEEVSSNINSAIGTSAWKAASEFLNSEDPVLVSAVVELAVDSAALDLEFERLRNELISPDTKPENRQLTSQAAALFVDLIDGHHYFSNYLDVPEAFETLLAGLQTPGTPVKQKNITESALPALIGHERALLGMLAAQITEKPAVQELVELFREFTKAGLLCSGWRSVVVYAEHQGWKIGEWVDGALALGPKVYDGYELLVFGDRPTISGFPVVDNHDQRISAEDFLAGLSAIENNLANTREINVDDLAQKTTLTPEFCAYLQSGVTGRTNQWGSEVDEKLNTLRETLGLGVTAFNSARTQLRSEPWTLLQTMFAALVPESDPAAVATYPDFAAMATAWSNEVGDLGHRITEKQRSAVNRATEPHTSNDEQRILRPLELHKEGYSAEFRFIAPLLTLAVNVRGDDPLRPFIAQQFETIKQFVEEHKAKNPYLKETDKVELGDSFDKIGDYRNWHVTRVLTEGLLDDLIEDLKHPYESPAGHPLDPLVSAPETVAEIATTLDLSEDSARYFLQVLALTAPTDASIREWNSWKKKDIDAAATPLTDRGLLITAKRSGAGRTRFLPGGWLESSAGEKGFEVWKAPLYLLWKDAKVRPIVRTCPPFTPLPQLFSDAWARYQSGDVPGYEELRTQRYRRR
ncbi:hypothetical protein AUP71_12470 [Corynebacterium glutamicum]|uniref:hypothetical protein n=1 Tax=Corynebacterium glutamicum TaxID=1718 RepID=UPI000942EA1B|nr:hypothetical protein [Corynebacterium glutamicum]OKX92290.1 hypothetical protein AUP71_12470 [Corynebacterium glutamicum]